MKNSSLLWLVLGTIAVVQGSVSQCERTGNWSLETWLALTERQLPPYLIWALVTPLVLLLARRVPLTRERWLSRGALHLGAAVAVTAFLGVCRALMHDLVVHHLHNGHAWSEWTGGGFLSGYELDLFIYCALVTAVWGLDAHRDAQERRRHEERLSGELAQAQVHALRMQMQPHFLFNTLNTVSALVERDPAEARRVLARLAELMRRVLDATDEQETTLAEELQFVRTYLEIERARFGERLAIEIDVDPELERERIPAFALQPLVENAIRHGIATSAKKGHVTLQARRDGDALVLTVRDSGPGPREEASTKGAGVALGNLRRRLLELYGAKARLSLEAIEGGCEAIVRIPCA